MLESLYGTGLGGVGGSASKIFESVFPALISTKLTTIFVLKTKDTHFDLQRRIELQTYRDTTTMISKTFSPGSTRVGPVASRRSRHLLPPLGPSSLSSAAFPRRPEGILKAFTPKIQGLFRRKSTAPNNNATPAASTGDGLVPGDGMTFGEIQSALRRGVDLVDLFSTETDKNSFEAFAAAQTAYSQRIRAAQYSGLPGARAATLRLDARRTAFERGFITTLDVPPTLIPGASRKATGTASRWTSTDTTTDGSLDTPLPAKEYKQVIIGRHYGTLVIPPRENNSTPTASAGTGPSPADGMTLGEIRSAIERGVTMVDLFLTEKKTDKDSFEAFAAAQTAYSQRIRAAQYSGLPGARAATLRLDARRTAFERGFITTLDVPPTLIPGASRKATGTASRSTSTAITAVTAVTAVTTITATDATRRVDVRPVNNMASHTKSIPHKSQTSALFSSKDLFQYLETTDHVKSGSKVAESPDSEGPKINFAQQFVKLVHATNGLAEKTRSILKALLRQMLRVAIAFIVMSALWLVPNVGAELACIFLIIIFNEK